MDDLIRQAAEKVAKAKKLVISTGAGVSQESGVPTFRDAQEGLWAQFDPQMLATPEGFRANPKLVWDWYAYRREKVMQTKPNPGHYAIAALEDLLPQVILVTQNVDNLHQLAGSSDIIALHGNLFAYKCFNNCQGSPTRIELDTLEFDPNDTPPRCPHCLTGLVRPDVVWFGEALPESNLARAFHEADTCDVMLVVGTSGAVYPAAGLPIRAAQHNAFVIEVNPNRSDLTRMMNIHLQGASGIMLPELISAVRKELAG